jgi:enoyl-CoA hydratase
MSEVRFEKRGAVAVLTVDRPKALNALNLSVLVSLREHLIAFHRDPALRVLVLTGGGERAFIAGADIAAMAEMQPAEALQMSRLGQEVTELLESPEKISIAAVSGFALGGGCEMAMACDLILASPKARFGQPEVRIGVLPGFGGTLRLTRLVGPQRARELIFTGRQIDAEEAARIGLVARIVADGPVLDAAVALATELTTQVGFAAVVAAKRCIAGALDMPISEGLKVEAQTFAEQFGTHDQREGMAAFLGKRPPNFTVASSGGEP